MRRVAFTFTLCATISAADCRAQHVLQEFAGDGQLGHAVSLAVDFDQDGRADASIGQPRTSPCGGGTGVVRVYTKVASLQPLLAHKFEPLWFAYGFDLDSAGDANGDGRVDLVVGAPDNHPDCPFLDLVQVHSARGGTPLAGNGLGIAEDPSVAGIGDYNLDGHDDFVMADPQDGARVFSGLNSVQLFALYDPAKGLGSAVSDLGDINLDGTVDFVIGARAENGTGTARIYLGGSGALYAAIPGFGNGERFGDEVDGVGDVNLDGRPDLLVAAPNASPGGMPFAGEARLISGATLAVLRSLPGAAPMDSFGQSVSRQIDFNGDGYDDIVVGSLGGYVKLFSGATGLEMHTFTADGMPGRFGFAVDGLGDVDGDGLGDLAIGSPGATNAAPSGVRIVSHCDGAIEPIGQGCAGSGGFVPALAFEGCPGPSKGLTLRIGGALGSSTAVLLFGLQAGSTPLPNGCALWLAQTLPLTLTLPLQGTGPGQGSILIKATLPANLAASAVVTQAFVGDQGAAGGYAASNAVRLVFP